MKIVALSDTHQLHGFYGNQPFGKLPEADMIIHCGDVLTNGDEYETNNFFNWFGYLPYQYKVFIAGNHDRCLQSSEKEIKRFCMLNRIEYLLDDFIEIQGVKIYGTPWTPRFGDWAYQIDSKEQERELWAKIPDDTDILVTHGPCTGILDGTSHGHVGAPLLESRIREVKPKYHLFGHVHENGGQQVEIEGTIHVNCSVHTWLWKQTVRQDPFVFEMSK